MHMRMTIPAALVTVMVVATMLTQTGCDTVRAPGAAGPDPISDAAYPQVVALEGLGRYLSSSEPALEGGDGEKPMHVAVPVRLRSDREIAVQYRFTFFDENRVPLQPRQGWRYKEMMPRAQEPFEGTATSMEARDWRLEIRPAR